MSENEKRSPETEADRLKNPSPIGTQQNPVSNPHEPKNRVAEDLEERKRFKQEHEIEDEDVE